MTRNQMDTAQITAARESFKLARKCNAFYSMAIVAGLCLISQDTYADSPNARAVSATTAKKSQMRGNPDIKGGNINAGVAIQFNPETLARTMSAAGTSSRPGGAPGANQTGKVGAGQTISVGTNRTQSAGPVAQRNQSQFDFLKRLATRNGYDGK